MAHFAQLDENNKVVQIIVVNNSEIMTGEVESEDKGISFCKSLFGEDTRWVQTSYNGKIRKNYAAIGYTYDPINNYFFAPQPYPSWVLDDNAIWQPPIPVPADEKSYLWNEETQSWNEVTFDGGN